MSVELVRDDDRPHVAHLALATGDHNLLRPAPLASLREVAEGLPEAVAVLAVVADGAAPLAEDTRGLSAGLDMSWAVDRGSEEGRAFLEDLYEAIQAVRNVDAVTVAACGGYALGAGFELALGCDFRVATVDASLGLPEIDVGLPTVVQGGLLVRHVGLGRAKELVYRGTVLSGAEALADGLVTEAPPAKAYPTAVEALVDELAAKAPSLLRTQKRVFRSWRSDRLEAGLRESVGPGGRSFGTDAQREGMTAFLEGREPDFSGR